MLTPMGITPDTAIAALVRGKFQLSLVTETWPPEINGVAMTLSRLSEKLAERQWQVHVIRPRQNGEQPAAEPSPLTHFLVPGLPIPGYAGLRFGLPVTAMLERAWTERRPDVVHIATEGPLGWAALKVARRMLIPVTTTFHTNFHRYCRHYRMGWLRGVVTRHLRTLHNQSAVTMVPDAALRQTLQQEGYRNVVVLGRGVDAGLFDPARRSKALRAAWGVRDNDLIALHVGRMAPEKNLDVVVQAFEQLKRRQPNARMVWVGEGPLYAKMQRRYPDHVFAGSRRGIDLAEHYASADVFLFPSLTETYGNVVPEAMASGLAVVAYDYAAAAMHITHKQNGLLAPFGDTERFLRRVSGLASDPDQLRRLGAAARETVLRHSWEDVSGVFEHYLHQAMQGGRNE
jgi:glycosyltransferase involved in cell wall biosynthesis